MKKDRTISESRKGYSPAETFNMLGISPSLGYKLIRQGTIPSLRLGEKRLVIPVNAVDRLLEEGLNR